MNAARFLSSVSARRRRPQTPFGLRPSLCSSPWQQQQQQQSLSSLATSEAGSDDDLMLEDKPVRLQQQQKSRLQALRAQLREEEAGNNVRKPTDPVAVWQTNGRTSSSSSSSSSSTKPLAIAEPQAVIDYRQLAANIPDLDTSQVLTDRFQRQHSYLRISLTEKCNLRCTYCMPEDGVPLQPAENLLQTHEILTLAQHFSTAGVTKFRLTGGEPTLRRDIVDVVAGLKALNPHLIGMTTNGITLAKQLPDLVNAGLSSMNLSLDTLDAPKFAALTRRPAAYMDRVWQALEMAVGEFGGDNARLVTKVNCVVQRGINDDEIAAFIRLTDQFPGLQVRFIEYMPFTSNGWNSNKLVPYQELLDNLVLNDGVVLQPEPSADPHDTTKWFRTATGGKIGFITSMTSHFCAGCNRVRLGADGQIKVCLFDGLSEISLRDCLRQGLTENEILKLVWSAVQKKKYSLGGHEDAEAISRDSGNNKPMTLIGG